MIPLIYHINLRARTFPLRVPAPLSLCKNDYEKVYKKQIFDFTGYHAGFKGNLFFLGRPLELLFKIFDHSAEFINRPVEHFFGDGQWRGKTDNRFMGFLGQDTVFF